MMLETVAPATVGSEDHRALAAAGGADVSLCTIVGIDGSFSRRLGAQLAVRPDGTTVGSLADGCLEAQLASDMAELREPRVRRYGAGSDRIDFRLPCGGGLDILLDPSPDRGRCRAAIAKLAARRPARLKLPDVSALRSRRYIPSLRIVAFGEGPELVHLVRLGRTMGLEIEAYDKQRLSLGKKAENCRFDRWTAAILLFHDHEWETPLLAQALASEAFYVGAQGGEKARIGRALALSARGVAEEQVARITSPVGLIPACKSPDTLALSALAEIVGAYERHYVRG